MYSFFGCPAQADAHAHIVEFANVVLQAQMGRQIDVSCGRETHGSCFRSRLQICRRAEKSGQRLSDPLAPKPRYLNEELAVQIELIHDIPEVI